MDQLRQQVARARRRLILEQFLQRLVWCLLAGLTVAAVAVAVPRIITLATLPANWDVAWFFGALAGALVAAGVWTYAARRTPLDAAIEIDRRFGLRERVASSLSLDPDDEASDVGQAVLKDALRAVSRIDVHDKFRVRLDRRAWWPLVPAASAFVLVTFFDRRAESSIEPNAAANIEEQVKQSAESLRKKIEKRRKQAREKGLERAEDIFKRIEQGTRELTEKKDIVRTQAAVKLNDLAKQLEQRRQQLGGKDGLKVQFQKMKNLGAGPADKAAQAMKQGDWIKALEEVEKLANDLREGKLSDEAKEQLAKQLEQMKDKLQTAADAHGQAMDQLKKQIEQQKNQGNLAKAGELQQKLDAMQQQQPHMDRLQQMAQQLGQIQQGLQQGDGQKAAEAMAQMAEQMQQMQQELNELAMLDAAMEQLQMAKDAMACGACQGNGCQECQGGFANMNLEMGGSQGKGIGRGVGNAPPAEAEKNASFRDTQVRQKPRQGPGVYSGSAQGPNIKGDIAESIQQEMATKAAEPADPLTSERLPSSRRQHAEQYFQLLREGP